MVQKTPAAVDVKQDSWEVFRTGDGSSEFAPKSLLASRVHKVRKVVGPTMPSTGKTVDSLKAENGGFCLSIEFTDWAASELKNPVPPGRSLPSILWPNHGRSSCPQKTGCVEHAGVTSRLQLSLYFIG